MGSYIGIYRPLNILLIAVAQVLCAYFLDRNAVGDVLWENGLQWLLLGTAACAAFGYWVNDFLDMERDAINKDKRSFISRLSIILVYLHFLVFILAALWSGFMLGVWFSGLFSLTLLALWLYSKWFKNMALLGNVIIAILCFYSIFTVYVLLPEVDYLLILYYASLAAVVTLCRELAKDAEDVHGDTATGGRTFPVVAGVQSTSLAIYGLIIFLVPVLLVSLYVHRLYFEPPLLYLYYAYAAIFIIFPLFKIAIDVRQIDDFSGFSPIAILLKYVFYTGILSIVFF